MLEQLPVGEVIISWKLDQLSRSLEKLVESVNEILEKDAVLNSLHDVIDTATPLGKIVFHLFAALAEFGRDIVRGRSIRPADRN